MASLHGSPFVWLHEPICLDRFLLASLISHLVFLLSVLHSFRSVMVLLAGSSTGWLPISGGRLQELVDAQETVYAVISDHCEKYGKSLETSIHAIPGVAPFVPDPNRKALANYQFVNEHSMGHGRRSRSASSWGSGSPAGNGNNPQANAFIPGNQAPAPPVRRGVRTPEEFMASVRALQARTGVRITIPPRRIIFGNLPEGTTISDVLCLVYGGAVERAWSVVDRQVIVQFFDDGACRRYFDANYAGIKVDGNHVITVEKPDNTDQLTVAQLERISSGVTRIIRLTGIVNDDFSTLCDLTKGYEVDHIQLPECDHPGVAYIFFRNITHSWDFKTHAEEDTANWGDCVVDYLPDTCQVAHGFHANAIRTRFDSAVVNRV